MVESSAASGRHKRYLLIGLALATLVEYWIFTRVLWADLDRQRLVAAIIFGVVALTGGTLWIAGLVAARLHDRTWWLAMVSPLGAIQVFAGLGLLLWVAGYERYLFLLALASVGCFVVFVMLLIWPLVRR